jgi:TP901 family phage tail tape measure protein
MADKQIYIKISADSAQPVAAVKAMRNELSRLQKAYDAINTSTATGAQRAQKLQKEMADLRALIKQQEADMKKVEKVITNLSNASLSQLNQALRQVKKEISRTSESSPKLEELRQKYKAITDQIKVMNGEMINIKKHMGELSTQTDSWLQRAINQQKQLVESTQKTSSAYQGQVNILHQLQNEQARRAVSTISDGGASADALRTARANLVSYRDQLGKGGILPASGNVATEIERINAELKKCDDQLDAIAGKEKQIELTTDQLQQKADNIILDPKKFSPKEIKAAIDEIQKKLDNLGTNDTARKKLNEQMKQLKNILDGVDHELVNIGDLLKPGNLRKAPLETLQKAAKQLENEMAKLNRDQQQYIDKQKQLAAIRGEIERTTGAINRQGSAWKTTFRNISMYFGVFQLFSIAQQKLQGMLQSNLAYSDQLADIRKVTGLATKEVNELSDSLATLNTRSTVQDLADLAYQGGKMGFGKYGVEGMSAFVRAADQVKVALSDDLGDDSLLQISKLVDTMGLIPKLGIERSMLAVGSSINQLSATSTASGTHIVDFAKRLTGLSRITGITTPELLALGSAADALGQAPEVAATAFGKLFTSLQTNHNLIEQQLNMEKGTINNLFSQGKAMEAILQIMEKMREKGNMNALSNIWKDLGSEGQRLIGVMATMSKNVDTVRAHVEESNVAFEEATSLTNEYALKQDTANAILEKGYNLWAKAFTNPEGVDMVKQMAQAWYDLSKSMTSNEASMWIMKNLLGLIAAELKILLALLPAILTGLLFKGASVAIIGLASSIGLMGKNAVLATLQTKGLVAAWHALNTAQKMNVIGLCISLLTGLAIAIASVIKKGNEATTWMQGFNSTMSDFNREFAIADDRLKRFKKAIDEAANGSRQRAAAIRNFNKEYGQYLSKMLTEKSTAADIAKAYKEVVKQLRAKIALQMKEKDITSQVAPRVGWSADRLTEYDNVAGGSAYNGTWLKGYVDDMQKAGKSVEEINKDLARKLGVNGEIAADAYKSRSSKSPTEWFDVHGYARDMRMNSGLESTLTPNEIRANNTRALTQAEQMLYAATRYASQAYSATNAMNRVNKKWKPFEEDLSTVTDETPGTLDNDAPDKEAEKRRKAEEAARRKALRAEMKEEQAKAQAIVDNVKNYYERQIAAITEMATKTGMDSELQKKLVDGMTVRMNNALANVRQAIAGTENDWADFRQSMINDLYEPLSEDGTNQSTQLLDNIIHNDIDKLKEMITVLSKELGQNGSVLLDQIWRKATENQLANAKQDNKAYQERQKVLLEKNYTGKVNLDYENQMEQFGVAELTSEQIAQMMGWSQKGNNEAIQQFLDDRTEQWQKAFASARKNVVDLLSVDANSEDAPDKVLTILFGKDYKSYLAGTGLSSLLDMSADQFKVFYQKLIEYSDAYTDAQKKAYDEAKRRADFIFNNNPTIQSIDQSTQQLSTINSDQQRFESDKNIGQQMGMSWNIDSDPEILRYRLLAERARLYYEDMARLREQDKISEQQLTDAKRQMMEAQSNMADQVARKFHERVSLLQNFSEPLNTFAEGVGESLGNMIYDTEQSDVKMKDLLKDMLKSYVKMSLQLIAQDLTRRVTKQLYYRQEEMDETMHQQTMLQIQQLYQSLMLTAQTTGDAARLTQHATSNATELSAEAGATTGKVGLGIAGGAAKIIGTLGFWGIPLIGVITALLMGLLSWAIGLAFGGDDSGASASDATPNVKLATGMLTYDSGNVQSVGNGSPVASPSGYAPSASPGGSGAPAGAAGGDRTPVLGSDGYVYQARQVPQLQTGLVTSPIATMVNGQPSLVGERGPEMVIGRETTAAMQMARPDLLAAIVKFDKNYSNGHAYRTYDEGNLSDFATVPDGSPSGEGTLTKEDIDGLRSSLSEFTAVMLSIKRNGLHVNKYGRGGIAQESQDGANFMRRNSGDRLWKG